LHLIATNLIEILKKRIIFKIKSNQITTMLKPPAAPRPHPTLVDKKMLDSKAEVAVENLDRSAFIFSKKQVIVANPSVNEFYTIQLKHPIVDDQTSVTLSLAPGEGMASNLAVTPSKVTFSKRSSGALVRVEITGESQAELLQDRQFTIVHRTTSKSYDYHKLCMPVQIYRLGVTFTEIAGAGQDEML